MSTNNANGPQNINTHANTTPLSSSPISHQYTDPFQPSSENDKTAQIIAHRRSTGCWQWHIHDEEFFPMPPERPAIIDGIINHRFQYAEK